MKTLFAVLAVSVLAGTAWAADNQGFYGSVGGGAYRLKGDGFDDTAPTVKLVGGYDFNQYFALEGGYTRLFQTSDRIQGTRVDIDGNVWDAAARLSYPFADRFSGYGRIGWAFYDVNADVSGAGLGGSFDESDDDFTWALGGSVDFTQRLTLRGEYGQIAINDVDDDFLSFMVSYRLGGF